MTGGRLRLVIFDVDGTLVDSQADILAAMAHAFGQTGDTLPAREQILGIVGLSLDVAMARLAPHLPPDRHDALVAGYKDAYTDLRRAGGAAVSSPLYPHALDVLNALGARPETLLGVATGKSARGLTKLIEGHALHHLFVTRQVADHHPSKPHPSMILTALAETGVAPADAVMVGDTTYDMEMARAAGVAAIGVDWGYHPRTALDRIADAVVSDFRALPDTIDRIWETAK